MKLLPPETPVVEVGTTGDGLPIRHRFEPRQIKAINAALSASRPLLVRGEPGVGKSQLARAAAVALNRVFVSHVVDARTESRDLLWHFDAVGRLAKAQVMGALQMAAAAPGQLQSSAEQALAILDRELAVEKFLHPRALWWAFDWKGAAAQAEKVGEAPPPQAADADPAQGCVVLIDEIDKAEPDVPNGLLEALGSGQFTPQGWHGPVRAQGPQPLVVITTNEERTLPDAFIRRCLVLHLDLPKAPERLTARLIERGATHFQDRASPVLLEEAAKLLARDRAEALQRHWRPLPGQAEYLDLVRAVVVQSGGDLDAQARLIDQVARFVLKKHPDAAPDRDGDDE